MKLAILNLFWQLSFVSLKTPQLSPVKYTCTKQTIYIQATFFLPMAYKYMYVHGLQLIIIMGVLHVEWHFMAAIIVKKKVWKKSRLLFFPRQMKVQFTKPNMLLLGSLTS